MRCNIPPRPLKLRSIIALVLGALACLGAGWADSWESITETATGVRSIQAEFVQEKHLKILARPLVSKGRLVFEKPASLRWEYISPLKSLLLMHDGRTRRFADADGQLVEISGAPVEMMPTVMAEITRWLGGRFSESTDFESELVPGEKIVLSPRAPALARIIKRIELAFADTPGMIRSVNIIEDEASFTVLEFFAPRLNEPVPEGSFGGP